MCTFSRLTLNDQERFSKHSEDYSRLYLNEAFPTSEVMRRLSANIHIGLYIISYKHLHTFL
jgi:hypothetical protein